MVAGRDIAPFYSGHVEQCVASVKALPGVGERGALERICPSLVLLR